MVLGMKRIISGKSVQIKIETYRCMFGTCFNINGNASNPVKEELTLEEKRCYAFDNLIIIGSHAWNQHSIIF